MSYNITKTLDGYDYLSNILIRATIQENSIINNATSLVSAMNTRLNSDENSFLSLQSRLTIDEGSMTGGNSNSFTSQIDSIASRLSTDETNNNASIIGIDSRLATDQTSINNNISQIAGLSSGQMTMTSQINSLGTRITTDQTNVASISTLTSSLNSNVTSLNTTTSTISTSVSTINTTLTNYTYTTGTAVNRFSLTSTNVTKIASPYLFLNANTTGYLGSDYMTWQVPQSITAGTVTSILTIMYIPNNYSILLSGTFTGTDATNVGNNTLWITFQNAGFSANATFPTGRYAKTVTPTVNAINYTGTVLGTTTSPLSAVGSQIVVTITSSTTFGVSINGKWTFTASAFSTI